VTRRGRLVLALAAACYLAAWALGSRPLYPVAVGLALAVAVAVLWVRLSARPMRLERQTRRRAHIEGDVVPVRLDLRLSSRIRPPGLVVSERLGRLGERTTRLDGLRGGYLLDAVPRGRYPFERATAKIEDPFGLAAAEVPLPTGGALLVRPRPVALERLFSDVGSVRPGGLRQAIRRPTGYDVHGVREWVEGESLHHVHWRSTARTGTLMVKELEDAPRDEVAVVLDARPGPAFDVQARAAASLVRAYALRHRETRLVVVGARTSAQTVHSLGGEWEAALDLLAAAEPDATRALEAALGDRAAAAASSRELIVVTSTPTRGLVERLGQLATARRRVSLVHVAASDALEPGLVRLRQLGVPVAVVRPGADLCAALGPRV
jgi:uncharacterized protein (DUF58 family)